MNYHIKTYQKEYQSLWDDFITRSANGTFLHQRKYMDYHADRFNDASLMIFKDNKLKAVLPAHRIDNELFAHNGLTYSDFIFHFKLKLAHKTAIVEQALMFLHQQNIEKLHLKTIPFVFHQKIDESNLYLYDRLQAEIVKIKPFFVKIKQNNEKVNRNRLKNLKKIQIELQLQTGMEFLPEFWKIVCDNLRKRYKAKPVHSADEIQKLAGLFPDKIRLFTVASQGKILAGALVFLIHKSLHFQYIHARNDEIARQAVEWLIYQIIKQFEYMDFISFGTSESRDNNLQNGLVYWKESLGGRIINQYFITVSTENYRLLKNVLQ
jgi:hypothetical protein